MLAFQIHLWILTALVALMIAVNIYVTFFQKKVDTSHFDYMKYQWEVENYEELLEYTGGYLRARPNNEQALYFFAQANLHLKNFESATQSAQKLAKSSPLWREEALELIKMIDEAASGS